MKTRFSIFIFISAMFLSTGVIAKENVNFSGLTTEDNGDRGNKNILKVVADCVPPSGYRQFELNNVKFGLETGGLLWENRPGGDVADYEVPKGGDVDAIFAGGLWMGGTSPDQQLKLAAITYRQSGTDFWPGPLTIDGTASVDPEICDEYDEHFLIRRQDCQLHRLYFQRVQDAANGLPDLTGDEPFENGYITPQYFYDYPAINFNPSYDFYLAPFFDWNGDGFYNPDDGDYPGYDLEAAIDCNTKCAKDPIPLFGDETLWWVFNDKGGIHTEFGGDPIGMEVRAQAFAFTSNDEINNMTFANYTLINQGTQTLIETYFGQWVDPDLGCFNDDYVGCDVERGLGYCYNGDDEDENCSGANGYGVQPPAVGIDFFEGPFQDQDFKDNPLTTDIGDAIAGDGIPYAGLGIGYGDGVGDPAFCSDPTCCDNERFGMRKFVYYNNDGNPVNGNPNLAVEVYNYLRGFWRNGQRMTYGEDGTNSSGTPCDYMFPGDTDPVGFGTLGQIIDNSWTEQNEGNTPADRRFLQSAGPFTLDPGEFNNITVGVVWARALSGGAFESVEQLRIADDKAQSLFDNCFRILNGPDAPDMTVQELDKEIILYVSNNNVLSTNFQEKYTEFDPTISDFYSDGTEVPEEEKFYEFQGYKIYQVVDETITANDLDNPDVARLAFQVDIEDFDDAGDPIGQIINFEFDPSISMVVPTEKVNGANEGISHTFLVDRDLFATGDNRLVNHTKYYFLAIAYGYNNYEDYNFLTQSGQALPYIESRKSAIGDIKVQCGIPHISSPEASGTVVNSAYGDTYETIRIEGEGNGGFNVELSQESIDEIMSGEPWRADELKYVRNFSPVNVKIVDPLNVQDANLQLSFFVPDSLDFDDDEDFDVDETFWKLENIDNGDEVISEFPIRQRNEQIVPEYGISIQVNQYEFEGSAANPIAQPLESTIEAVTGEGQWINGIPDIDGQTEFNWIRSGSVADTDNPNTPQDESQFNDYTGRDDDEIYENILEGTVAPWYLTAQYFHGPSDNTLAAAHSLTSSDDLSSVDIVFTSDKSKWTRCAILEIQEQTILAEGGASKTELREALSVDKNGRNQDDSDHNHGEATYNNTQIDNDGKSYGMGWFPGYAIDIESGERLNMAFGENSWLAGENGRDMLWNPSSTIASLTGEARMGGMHYVYVYRNDANDAIDGARMPAYDGGSFLYQFTNGSSTEKRRVWRSCMWVVLPFLNPGASLLSAEDGLIPSDVRVRIRISTEYKRYAPMKAFYPQYWMDDDLGVLSGVAFEEINPYGTDPVSVVDGNSVPEFIPLNLSENNWFPRYRFESKGIAVLTDNTDAAKDALDLINVVPNPYYAFSEYEQSRLDNRVKIANVPERCIISIYNTSGTLVRQFNKDNPDTYVEWDLKNSVNIPIAGGMYILHIDAPGIGEKVVKWFGVMRPTDLENF